MRRLDPTDPLVRALLDEGAILPDAEPFVRSARLKGCALLLASALAMGVLLWGAGRAVMG